MDLEKMGKLGVEVGSAEMVPEKRPPGRPVGAVLEFESPKKKGQKWCEKEIYRHRKTIRDQAEKLAALEKAGVEGAGDAVAPAFPPELWGILPSLAYDYLAVRFGDYWKLGKEEIRQWGIVTEKCVNRYMGVYVAANPELAALIMVATVTTLPRSIKLLTDMKEKGAKKNVQRDGGSAGDNGPGSTGVRENALDKSGMREAA